MGLAKRPVKLLCRFYDVESGAILLDRVDPAQHCLRRQLMTLIQFPVVYQATARENIALGDVQRRAYAAAIEATRPERGRPRGDPATAARL